MAIPMLGGWSDVGSVESIARAVRGGDLDPVELTHRALRRAAEVAELNAVVHLDPEGALRTAEAVGRTRQGQLAGVPVLVKEIIAVAGMPFTCGSRVFADRIADADAEVVGRVRAAGAVIIGLSHSHEFAYGPTGVSHARGPCRNPHDPTRMTGGSSAGSAAAVAAGVVPLALGTDTAGSVRIPAALCGVVGAMPARNTLPRDGVFPLAASLDIVGVLTASVADARYAIGALAGLDVPAGSPTAPRLGVVTNPEPTDSAPAVGDAFRACLDRLAAAGAELVEVTLPDWPEISATGFDLQGPEAYATHADLLATRGDHYQPDVRERLAVAAEVPGWRYLRAVDRAAALTAELTALLHTVDAVLQPTVPIVAPPLDATKVELPGGPLSPREALLRNTRPANVTGHPALSLPLPSASDLPVGLQLMAADNDRMFAAARWVDQAVGGRH